VILEFYPQYREMRTQHGTPGSLSLFSLILQALFLGLIAIRWFLRLGTPTWESTPMPVYVWLEYFSMILQWAEVPILYTVNAVGNLFLFTLYKMQGSGRITLGVESEPDYYLAGH
jgi:hypothetical protein